MKIVVLGLASDDVDAELREMQIVFGDAIQSAITHESLPTHVQTLFFTPIVTRPGIGPFPDRITYPRKGPAVNLAVNIPHEKWIEGGRTAHVNLIAETLIRGIDQIKDSKFSSDTKDILRRVIESVRRSLIGEASAG